MNTLYPNLYERFRTEGLCPICLMEMELTPRYSCVNRHTVCHRCKPYYYGCPTCMAPLDIEILPPHADAPQPTHYMPHPPPMNDFLSHERAASWEPPVPSYDQQIEPCRYSHLGCWVKVPEHLRALHESRCQFRPHLEEEHMPTDLQHGHDDLVECSYSTVGCKVRMAPWRRDIHEKFCNYRNDFRVSEISDGLASATIGDNDYGGDPEELVQCKYRRYGCMVNMPRRRKYTHEQKCNYRSQYRDADDEFFSYNAAPPSPSPPPEPQLDPEEQVECRWFVYGCRVKPKRFRKQIHEDKCNYRMEECAYKDYGCGATFMPSGKYAHESRCEFAN